MGVGKSTTDDRDHTVTVGFSIAEADRPRLDHLVDVFAGGNRSAFLRLAMRRMEVADRAQRLRSIQAYGAQRSQGLGLAPDETSERVRRVLARKGRT